MLDNSTYRYGSADFATAQDIKRAGMFEQKPNSLLVGFMGKKPLWYSDMGGLLLTAGARGGKLRDILGFNVAHSICLSTMLILDMKGELAAISQNQAPDNKRCIYWNPSALHSLPQHRINPLDYLHINSASLVSDTKVLCENQIPNSGSSNAQYFENRAREICEALILTLAEQNGTVTFPDLYRVINMLAGGGDKWLEFAFLMSQSRFPIAVRIEEEIANSRDSTSNGFQAILGELFKGFAALSDPTLMASVSPPYDFSLAQLCENDQAFQFYMMPPAEFIDAWASVIKAMFVGAMIYKSRAPRAPQQTWILDECGQLGAFPLIVKMFTYGAGIGIRPWAIFQSKFQMNLIGHNAENIITSSAALRSYFAVRDIETATSVSRMIGAQTLDYEDEHKQLQLQNAKRKAVQNLLMGGDPLSAGLDYVHQSRALDTPQKIQRMVRTPDEILNTPADKQYIFTDKLPAMLYADRKPYYEQKFMAGRFNPNPYHS